MRWKALYERLRLGPLPFSARNEWSGARTGSVWIIVARRHFLQEESGGQMHKGGCFIGCSTHNEAAVAACSHFIIAVQGRARKVIKMNVWLGAVLTPLSCVVGRSDTHPYAEGTAGETWALSARRRMNSQCDRSSQTVRKLLLAF